MLLFMLAASPVAHSGVKSSFFTAWNAGKASCVQKASNPSTAFSNLPASPSCLMSVKKYGVKSRSSVMPCLRIGFKAASSKYSHIFVSKAETTRISSWTDLSASVASTSLLLRTLMEAMVDFILPFNSSSFSLFASKLFFAAASSSVFPSSSFSTSFILVSSSSRSSVKSASPSSASMRAFLALRTTRKRSLMFSDPVVMAPSSPVNSARASSHTACFFWLTATSASSAFIRSTSSDDLVTAPAVAKLAAADFSSLQRWLQNCVAPSTAAHLVMNVFGSRLLGSPLKNAAASVFILSTLAS
mmetsp:Transcript_29187/g.86826  ORF Transcript_29187/g.86826 Transcript_29187/m.86826 type:complete len:301 (+) Transcript_29187:730-1632(+)